MARADLERLVAEGWKLVPIRPGTKRPSDNDWLKLDYGPADFQDDWNVGAKLGKQGDGMIDVDCDTAEACIAAKELLPRTRMHGRAGKPDSHFWFKLRDTPLPTAQYKDVDGAMLVEFRSSDHQTVIPPSIHSSGEPIVWTNPHQSILQMDASELSGVVKQVACATLLARHWPAGSRHVAAGHLGGYLARSKKLKPEEIERVVAAAARAANDEEVADRARYARETAEKHLRGEKTTGGPGILELFSQGDQILNKLATWLEIEGEDELEELNRRHFVTRIGKDVVVGMEKSDGFDALTFQTFKNLYYNRFVGKMNLGEWWLKHPRRRSFERVVFVPPGSRQEWDPIRDYNLWHGFACAPDPHPHPEQRCPRFLGHVRDVIASGDAAVNEYVLDLLADCVQRPGDPIGKALALRGGQGVGKSVFVEAFGELFGPSGFIALSHREQVVGKFNAHLAGKIVVFADEAIWGGNRQDVGTLKHMTTQRTIAIQPKGVDIFQQPNFLHLFIATNEKWAWPAGERERRGVILDVTAERPESYFDALWEEIRSAHFAPALLAVLMARDVDRRRLRRGISNEALREQQSMSGDPVKLWWEMILTDGVIGTGWPRALGSAELYQKFCDDMGSYRGAGFTHRGTRLDMTRRLKELLPLTCEFRPMRWKKNIAPPGHPPVYDTVVERVVELPPLAVCRDAFDAVMGTTHKWPVIAEPGELAYDQE